MPGGRPPGSLNKKTANRLKAIEDSGLMPLDLMLQILRDQSLDWELRLQAAKDAAPYCHARVATKEDRAKTDNQITIVLAWPNPSNSEPYISRERNLSRITNGHNAGPVLSLTAEPGKP